MSALIRVFWFHFCSKERETCHPSLVKVMTKRIWKIQLFFQEILQSPVKKQRVSKMYVQYNSASSFKKTQIIFYIKLWHQIKLYKRMCMLCILSSCICCDMEKEQFGLCCDFKSGIPNICSNFPKKENKKSWGDFSPRISTHWPAGRYKSMCVWALQDLGSVSSLALSSEDIFTVSGTRWDSPV